MNKLFVFLLIFASISFPQKITDFGFFDDGFTPKQISGLVAWYESALSSVTVDANNYVSKWVDKSGNGNDLVQTTAISQPKLSPYYKVVTQNFVVNGTFDSDVSWTKISGITISGGTMNFSAVSGGAFQTSTQTFVNKVYRVYYRITAYTSGSIRINLGGYANTAEQTAVGSYLEYITVTDPTSNKDIYAIASAFTGSIDDLMVEEVTTTGTATIVFDGTNDYLSKSFTLVQPTTIFAVLRPLRFQNGDSFFDGYNNVSALVQQYSTVSPIVRAYAGSHSTDNANLVLNGYKLVRVQFNGATSILQINNTTETTGNFGSGNAGGITVGRRGGGSYPAYFGIVALFVYNKVLTSAETTQLKAYIERKWCIGL